MPKITQRGERGGILLFKTWALCLYSCIWAQAIGVKVFFVAATVLFDAIHRGGRGGGGLRLSEFHPLFPSFKVSDFYSKMSGNITERAKPSVFRTEWEEKKSSSEILWEVSGCSFCASGRFELTECGAMTLGNQICKPTADSFLCYKEHLPRFQRQSLL